MLLLRKWEVGVLHQCYGKKVRVHKVCKYDFLLDYTQDFAPELSL